MKRFLLAASASVLVVVCTATAQAQGWGAALGAFSNGYQQGQMQAQQLEAMQLQNELLRLQIERERAEDQARKEAYARALAQPQSPRSMRSQPSEACAALQSVIDARQRYGIVAASREEDEDALRRCGLPQGGGSGPLPNTASGSGQPTAPRGAAGGGMVACQYYVSPGVCGSR
jgi:hypothetical protein